MLGLSSSPGISGGLNSNGQKTRVTQACSSNYAQTSSALHTTHPTLPESWQLGADHTPHHPSRRGKPLSAETGKPLNKNYVSNFWCYPLKLARSPSYFLKVRQHLKLVHAQGISNQPAHDDEKTANNHQIFGQRLLTSKAKTKVENRRKGLRRTATAQETENVYEV